MDVIVTKRKSQSTVDFTKIAGRAALLACILGMGGCASVTAFNPPEVEMKQSWRVDHKVSVELANTAWWESFNDPTLNGLIETALQNNNDLMIAAARIDEIAGLYEVQNSSRYPQIGYGADAGGSQRSLEQPLSFPGLGNRTNEDYSASLKIGWELDIWGKLAQANEAARAELMSAEENRQAVIMSLVSSVAVEYIELLNLDKKLSIANQTLIERKRSLDLFESKMRGGQISELELAQVRSSYQQAASQIPVIELDILLQENRLSLILGKDPGPIARDKDIDSLTMLELPTGLPSDLLVRRPDIRQVVQRLAAANARAEIASKEYLPNLSLGALLGYASDNISSLFDGSAGLWDAALSVAGPIYTGGRIEGTEQQAEAARQQLIYEYKGTIQRALKEVDDGLVSLEKLRELQTIQTRHVDVLEDYVEFAISRHDAGYSRYMEVLDAQRNLYNTQISLAKTEKNIFTTSVNLYKAMGGGWVKIADEKYAKSADSDASVSP